MTSRRKARRDCEGTPLAGRGQFTAALEVQDQQRLVMSFLHHMAVQRLCKNPFEDAEVAGITNYLDFGLQVHCHPRMQASPKYLPHERDWLQAGCKACWSRSMP